MADRKQIDREAVERISSAGQAAPSSSTATSGFDQRAQDAVNRTQRVKKSISAIAVGLLLLGACGDEDPEPTTATERRVTTSDEPSDEETTTVMTEAPVPASTGTSTTSMETGDYGLFDEDPRAGAIVDQILHQIDLPEAWTDREVWNVVVAACSSLYVEATPEAAADRFLSAPDTEPFGNQVALLGVPELCPERAEGFAEAMAAAGAEVP